MQPIKETVGFAIAQVCRAHRGSVDAALKGLAKERGGCAELHVGQEMILLQLWAEDGMTQSQLAERLGTEPPTVSKMLHRMELAGLVTRRADALDARVSRVYLSELGRVLEGDVAAAWAGVEDRATAGMTAEERLLLRRLLLIVYANLEK